jgi:hypothetical protein
MPERKVVRKIQNIADLSVAGIENDIEYLLFVDNEVLFPMADYLKLQPIVADLAKLILVHADAAASKMQDEVVRNVAVHFKEEAARVVYRSKTPTTETLTITEAEVEPHHDW